MIEVALNDPTTYKSLLDFIAMLAMPACSFAMLFIFSSRRTIKMMSVILIIASITACSFIESARETRILNDNIASIEDKYGITNLSTSDRMGIDPGEGTVRTVPINYVDNAGISREGLMVIDATDKDHITAAIPGFNSNDDGNECK